MQDCDAYTFYFWLNINGKGLIVYQNHWVDHTFIHYNTIINNSEYGIVVTRGHTTVVEKNNIFGNHQNAYFEIYLFTLEGWPKDKITWRENYWGKISLRHKIICGKLFIDVPSPVPNVENYIIFRWLNIDWHPALEPYDIPEVR